MKHNNESKVPKDMKSTNEGEFKEGDKVTITAAYMPSMKGPETTMKSGYKTYIYVVSYKPINGEEKVNNHKWVVNEEIKDIQKMDLVKARLLN